ncbi:MAG: tetratricopeptide repeat protein [Spirosomataceae bacterium]
MQGADFEWNQQTRQAYQDIRKLKVASGKAILAQESPQNGIKVFLDDYADMVYLLISEDPAYFKKVQNLEDERLELVERLDKNSPYQRFVLAEIRLHWAFVKLKFGKEISGCWDIIKAYKLLDENTRKFPSFLPTQKSLGLLHVLIGATPENYQWVPNLLGLRGNIQQGLSEIQSVIAEDTLFRQETQLIDFLLHSYLIGMDESKLSRLEEVVQKAPDDLLFHLFGASMLIKNNQSERALAIIERRLVGTGYLTVPSLEYLRGEALLEKGLYLQAIEAFKRYLRLQKGHNFIKDSHYKLFLAYWLQGSEAEGLVYLHKIKLVGTTITEQDKAAQQFVEHYERGYRPVVPLIKARLAFDGGFYEQALHTLRSLNETELVQLKDKAEFNYRLGRIYQKTNAFAQAITHYERAIVLSDNTNWSFGATSSLQLGYIYQRTKQLTKADYYFKKAISYRNHEYKNSIDNKAKAALNSMKLDTHR